MSCCALCPCQLSWPSDTQGSKRDPINSEKAWLDFAVRLLSRELVGKGRGQETVWSEKCKPVWWDEKVGLPWKNPTSNPKDTKDILQKKYAALESQLLAEKRFPLELDEEARLWNDAKINDLFDLTLLISLLGKVRGVHRAVVDACGKIMSMKFGADLLNDMHQCVTATLHVLEGVKSHTPCAPKRSSIYPEAETTMTPLKKKNGNVESSREPFVCTVGHFRAPTALPSLMPDFGNIPSNFHTKPSSQQANKLQHHEISNHCTSQTNYISQHVMPVGPTRFTSKGPTLTTLKPKQQSKLVYPNPSVMTTDQPNSINHNPSDMTKGQPNRINHNPSDMTKGQPNRINHNPSDMRKGQPNRINHNPSDMTKGQPYRINHNPSYMTTDQPNRINHNPSDMTKGQPNGVNHNPSDMIKGQPHGVNHNPSNMITCQPNVSYPNPLHTKINQPKGIYYKPRGLDTTQLNNKYNPTQTGETMSTTRLDDSLMSYEDLPPSPNNVHISKDNTSCVQQPHLNLTPTASNPTLTSSSSDDQGGNGLVAVILDNFESLSPGQRNWLDDFCVDPLLDDFSIDDPSLDDFCVDPLLDDFSIDDPSL
ncbi:unnamed protein product, partial [Lymnaea stagnalis]